MTQQELLTTEKKAVQKPEVEETKKGIFYIPPVDIFETKEALFIVADMPGVSGENVEIDLKDNQLTITGKVKSYYQEDEIPLYTEYGIGDYVRQFSLSSDINQEKISAEMKNGVLKLVLPKAEKAKARKITVS